MDRDAQTELIAYLDCDGLCLDFVKHLKPVRGAHICAEMEDVPVIQLFLRGHEDRTSIALGFIAKFGRGGSEALLICCGRSRRS
jgi:hypothetical protein